MTFFRLFIIRRFVKTNVNMNRQSLIRKIVSENFIFKDEALKLFECIHCNQLGVCHNLSGKKIENLKTHLVLRHKVLFETKYGVEKKEKELLAIQRLELLQHFTELTTINLRPYKSLQDSGLTKIIKDKVDRLIVGNMQINVPKDVIEYTSHVVEEVKKQITFECKNRIICVMIDIVTKNNISFLGIIIRYVFNGAISERCIGVVVLNESHTADFISKTIAEHLERFEINPQTVLATTSDNAPNMISAINKFGSAIYSVPVAQTDAGEDELEDNYTEEHEFGYFRNDDNYQCTLDILSPELSPDEILQAENELAMTDDAIENVMGEIRDHQNLSNQIINDFNTNFNTVFNIRCAAHTLQLAVKDAIKAANISIILSGCRKVALLLRHQEYVTEAKQKGIPLIFPRLSNNTRWDSELRMVSNKEF